MKRILFLFFPLIYLSSTLKLTAQYENPLELPDFIYSEKTTQKYIQQAARTKPERILNAFSRVTGEGLRQGLVPFFASLYLGDTIQQTNKELTRILRTKDGAIREKYRLNDPWCLATNQLLYRMYYSFGSKGTIFPGRITAETEKAILDFLWDRLLYKNDIHLARKSTWWMIGSENHDLVAKISSLITSRIFMDEPEYRDRIYPDLGTGGGHAYWFHHMYGKDRMKGPEGRATEKDGKSWTAKDHYIAWIKYFDEYFTERAKKGFFLEVASPGYMAVSLSYHTDLHDLCGNKKLETKSEMFLNLVWADWAQDQLNGVRGGAKTRDKDGLRWNDAMCRFARFYFGGEGSAQTHYFCQLLSSFQPHSIIWHLALDRKGMGEYAFISRKPGEEENNWPRPAGAERTLLCDTESRFVRYSWVTPDYILGCQMDHPAAVHSHLSLQKRWQGITFKGENGPRVFPAGLKKQTKAAVKDEVPFYRCIQHQNVMIVQQSRGFTVVNPDWFPSKNRANQECAVYIGDGHDRLIEEEGWIFIEHGDAFLALRCVTGEYAEGWKILMDEASEGLTSKLTEDSYSWSEDKKMINLKDKYAGIIFEASRRTRHASLEAFIADILDNPIALDKTVVPGFHILRYTGCGKETPEIYFNLANNEISMIDGKRINYSPDFLFKSPYLNSEYNSGIINISKEDKKLSLDFN